MRLIDADALKESMKFSEGTMSDNFIIHVPFREVITNIDKSPTVCDWISVKDRPPEKDQDVIIYGSWTGVTGTVYKETRFISMDEAIYEGFTPIAWIQLPKLPKEWKEGEVG